MTQEEMFEKSFERTSNYFKLTPSQQWDIDEALGLLDWMPDLFTPDQMARFKRHYDHAEVLW